MRFYKLCDDDLNQIYSMTASEIKIYLWLSVSLPFADSSPLEIDTSYIAEQTGLTRRSVQRALSSLAERKLFEVELTRARVRRAAKPGDRNVATATGMSPQRQECHRSDRNATAATAVSPSPLETSSEQAFQPPKTIQTIQTPPEGVGKEEQNPLLNSQEPIANNQFLAANDSGAIASVSSRKLASSSGLSSPPSAPFISAYQKFGASAHPALIYSEECPWLLPPQGRTFTKFKSEFLDWGAREFLEEFGKKDFYKARADFLAYLKNSPDKIESKWEQYCCQTTHKAVTTAARINSGIAVSNSERQFLLENKGAIAPLDSLKVDSKILAAVIPEGAEGISPYQEFTGDTDNFWKNICSKKSMPAIAPQESDEERWYRWLSSGDTNIAKLAVKQAKAAGYKVLCDGDFAYGFTRGGES